MLNPQSSLNSASSLNDSSGLHIIEIMINNIKIGEEYIQDLEIIYDGSFKIKGYFVINDIYDLQTQAFIEPGQIANIKLIDQHNDYFERDFIIVRSYEEKIQDSKGINFVIQDIASWKLQNTYVPKSWDETTLIDIFNYVFELEAKPLVPKIKLKTKQPTPERKLKNFCIPLNINFLDFITEEFRKEGTFFYQTKTEIVIGDFNIPETPQFPYKQTGADDLYGFVIMEYYLAFNNILENNIVLPRTEFIAYDSTKKDVVIHKNDLNTYKEDLKFSGKAYNSQVTYKARYSTQEYLRDTTKYKYLQYLNNTQLVIFVPGNVKYSEMYKKIDVFLSGSVSSKDTMETGDYKLSGKYMIMKIEDKILLGQKFIQKLTVKRVNEEEKA